MKASIRTETYLRNVYKGAYKITAKDGTFDGNDPVARRRFILQNNLLHPVFGIEDPRTDKRIDFIGGIRGLKELEKRVQEGMVVALLYVPYNY